MTEITVPQDLWDSEDEGVILTWIYATGAVVEKAQLELVAPAAGKLTILAPPDTVVKKGTVIGRID